MNLLAYFLVFGKFLWDAVFTPKSSSPVAAAESQKNGRAGDVGVDEDKLLKEVKKPAGDKRKIQDMIHQRYMNWVKKQGNRETPRN